MAEAQSHRHATGRFHEFFRIFERAFRTDCERLAPLLFGCADKRYGYSLSEIETWIRARGPLTHADRRKEFLLERNACPLVYRMEQAAIDVLVNKANWRSADTLRKERWAPAFGLQDGQSGIYITRGKEAQIDYAVFDQFGTYPVHPRGCINKLPEGWWVNSALVQTPTDSE